MSDNTQGRRIAYDSATFIKSAAKLNQCPPDIGNEVAFAGRSNAGKSSAINTLTRQKKLARTSKTPGRTQLINFFGLNAENCKLVDLPGYGFAKVPNAVKREWQQHLDDYLRNRESLRGLVLLMDIRNPLTDFDLMMADWCEAANLPLLMLLTKSDKLKRGAAQNTLLKIRKSMAEYDSVAGIELFSSLKKTGVDIVYRYLDNWLIPEDASSEHGTPTPPESD